MKHPLRGVVYDMSRYYDKNKLKEELEVEQIYDLFEAWGGEPEYINGGIVAQTICHNLPGEGSRKLYYYENTQLCHCYTGCTNSTFDIFDLCIKVKKNQEGIEWELYDAMDYIASYFGLEGEEQVEEEQKLEDWTIFKRHKELPTYSKPRIKLKEYNPVILTRFIYPRIPHWEKEGIPETISKRNFIGYYPGKEQITIPHFDKDNRLVGIRGRSLAEDEVERYGKYRPLLINRQLYNHPLSMNLYNLNNSKDNIKKAKVAIIYESEKSCLQYQSYYGQDNDISVACCGSSISSYHIDLLRELGVLEIIIAFDRQFIEIGDDEFKRLKNRLIHLAQKYGKYMKVSAIFDKNKISPYKSSPTDVGQEIFEKLLKERIKLT